MFIVSPQIHSAPEEPNVLCGVQMALPWSAGDFLSGYKHLAAPQPLRTAHTGLIPSELRCYFTSLNGPK